MVRATIFKDGAEQLVRLPREFELKNVIEVEIRREGESIVLTPLRKNWTSFINADSADDDFLTEHEPVIEPDRTRL